MFTSLKQLINSRLGEGIVLNDMENELGYVIAISPKNLHSVAFFLKNDPDTRLLMLDQIVALTDGKFFSTDDEPALKDVQILYQLKSLKLPYQVALAVVVSKTRKMVPSLANLFSGAKWFEEDIALEHDIFFEEGAGIFYDY